MRLNLFFRVARQCRLLEESCGWTRDQLEYEQFRRLAALRRFAVEHSPFYRRFHRGLEDRPLQDLPILTKSILMDNFDELVTDREVRLSEVREFLAGSPGYALFRERYVVLLTSGSTGMQGVFLFNPQEWLAALANIARPVVWSRPKQGLRMPQRSAIVASRTPWHHSDRVAASFCTRWMLRLDAAEPIDLLVQRLNAWQPRSVASYPSILRQLAQEQLAGRLRVRLLSAATCAEVLTNETRKRVHDAWGIRIYDTYGATEYAPIAAECSHGNMHLVEDGAIIEVIDARGRTVPPGVQGDRILLTVFSRWTQPLIRYEITDSLILMPEQCECGRNFRVVSTITGRHRDILTFPHKDGRRTTVTAHANLLYPVLETVPATAWQVVHDEHGLWISFVGLRDTCALSGISESISSVLEHQGALVPPIHVREVAELERGATGKAPLILSRLR